MSENIKMLVTLQVRVDGTGIDEYLKNTGAEITKESRSNLAHGIVKDVFTDLWEFATGLPRYNSRDYSPNATVEEIKGQIIIDPDSKLPRHRTVVECTGEDSCPICAFFKK